MYVQFAMIRDSMEERCELKRRSSYVRVLGGAKVKRVCE